MSIEIPIEIVLTPRSQAVLDALYSSLSERFQAPEPTTAPEAPATQRIAINDPWPGMDGVYAGVSRGEDGEPDAHLVLLNATPEKDMAHADAVAWAASLGDGARLPTRFESALLYAHLRDRMDTDGLHWTGTQYSADDAWFQGFRHGYQTINCKSAELRVRAVRRLPL